jgi:hypothetical protein
MDVKMKNAGKKFMELDLKDLEFTLEYNAALITVSQSKIETRVKCFGIIKNIQPISVGV